MFVKSRLEWRIPYCFTDPFSLFPSDKSGKESQIYLDKDLKFWYIRQSIIDANEKTSLLSNKVPGESQEHFGIACGGRRTLRIRNWQETWYASKPCSSFL